MKYLILLLVGMGAVFQLRQLKSKNIKRDIYVYVFLLLIAYIYMFGQMQHLHVWSPEKLMENISKPLVKWVFDFSR